MILWKQKSHNFIANIHQFKTFNIFIFLWKISNHNRIFAFRHILRFFKISVKHFNVKNQIKLMFATIFNAYCTDLFDKFAKTYYNACIKIYRFFWMNLQNHYSFTFNLTNNFKIYYMKLRSLCPLRKQKTLRELFKRFNDFFSLIA